MIVLFPFDSFQSLLFSIVDAGKIVGGVEAVDMWKKWKKQRMFRKKGDKYIYDDKNSKLGLLSEHKSFFCLQTVVYENKINALS